MKRFLLIILINFSVFQLKAQDDVTIVTYNSFSGGFYLESRNLPTLAGGGNRDISIWGSTDNVFNVDRLNSNTKWDVRVGNPRINPINKGVISNGPNAGYYWKTSTSYRDGNTNNYKSPMFYMGTSFFANNPNEVKIYRTGWWDPANASSGNNYNRDNYLGYTSIYFINKTTFNPNIALDYCNNRNINVNLVTSAILGLDLMNYHIETGGIQTFIDGAVAVSFNPSNLTPGEHTLEYRIESSPNTDGVNVMNNKDRDYSGFLASDHPDRFVSVIKTINISEERIEDADYPNVCQGDDSFELIKAFTSGTWQAVTKPAGAPSVYFMVGPVGGKTHFLPDGLPAGYYELKQKATSYDQCGEVTFNITISPNTPVTWTAPTNWSVCKSAVIDLTSVVDKNDNLDFSWDGGSGSTFDADNLNAGSYVITAVYTSANGCRSSNEKTITILPEGSINAVQGVSLCQELTSVDIGVVAGVSSNGLDPSTIVYTGSILQSPGTSSGIVNPSSLSPGITYTVEVSGSTPAPGSCSYTKTISVTVKSPTTTNKTDEVCLQDDDIKLDYNGTWSYEPSSASNPIVSKGSLKYFDVGLATPGTEYILTATNNNSCTNYNHIITVSQDPSLTFNIPNTEICKNAQPLNLYDFIDVSTGVNFSWIGGSGYLFDPSRLNQNQDYTITATYTLDNGCRFTYTDQIRVKEDVTVSAGQDEIVCINEGIVDLSDIFSETSSSSLSGYWSGDIVTNDLINTDNLEEGRSYVITYNVEVAGCTFSDNANLIVSGTPDVYAGGSISLCVNSDPYPLASTGFWYDQSGTRITNINPSNYSAGTQSFRFVRTNSNGCEATDYLQVQFTDPNSLTIGGDIEICNNDIPYNLFNDIAPSDRGGDFTGNSGALSDGFFDPSRVLPGDYIITYTIEEGNGNCFSTEDRVITVKPIPVIDPGFDVQICKGEPQKRIDLNTRINGVANNNIVFSGQGVSEMSGDFYFNQTGLTAGTYVVTATYTDPTTLCSSSTTKNVRVTSLPSVSAGPDLFLCSSTPLINMTDGSPSSGTYSGPGVSNNRFDASAVAPGATYQITYTYQDENGCSNSAIRNITVDNSISITINPPSASGFVFCETDNTVDLSPYVSPFAGGIAEFSGVGVSGTSFNPKVGPGVYSITYEWSNDYGCSASRTFNVNVNAVPTGVSAGSKTSICLNAAPYDLMAAASPKSGVFEGVGVYLNDSDSKYYFDPAISGSGTAEVFYTVTNSSGCSITVVREIEVKPLPSIDAGANITVCQTSGLIDLDEGSSASGTRTWSGLGADFSIVDPADLSVGTHNYVLSVQLANGCQVTDSKTITIVADPILTVVNDPLVLCSTDGQVSLNSDVNFPNNTTWTGTGVVNGTSFDPSIIENGDVTVVGTYVSPYGCSSQISRTVRVIGSPTVTVGGPVTMCATAFPFDLKPVGNPSNGSWSGSGIENGVFYPDRVGPGNYIGYYSFTSIEGCTVITEKTITVTSPPSIDAGPSLVTCINSDDVFLDDNASISGGTWEGRGVNLNIFSPAEAGVGTHQLKMSYDFGQGCVSTDYLVIKVTDPLTVDAGEPINICRGSGLVNLAAGVSISGGTFEGPNVNGNLFNSDAAIAGTYNITYSVENSNGCSATDQLLIVVKSNPILTVGPLLQVCNTADSVEIKSYFNPVNGSISSPYVVNDYFRPKGLAPGEYEVVYTLTNSNNCTSTISKFVQVVNPEPINAGPDIIRCLSAGDINIDEGASQSGGTWRVLTPGAQSAISGSYFSPSTSGIGTFEIELEVNFGSGCRSVDKKVIKVEPDLTVNAGADLEFCQGQGLKSVAMGVDKSGGTWSGDYVNDQGQFDTGIPQGQYEVSYTINNSYNCSATSTKTITILPKPVISLGQAVEVCNTNNSRIDLEVIIPTSGLTFTGPGIEDDHYFNGFGLLAGDYDVTVTKSSSSGCVSQAVKRITVVDPVPIVTQDVILCKDSEPISLEFYSDKRGAVFTGPGVTDNIFDPAAVPVGNTLLNVEYDDGSGCISYGDMFVNVRNSLSVSINTDTLKLCKNDAAYNLNIFVSNLSGSWSGVNVSSTGVFSPSNANSGSIYKAYYTIVDQYACSATDSMFIQVSPRPSPITVGSPIQICNTQTDRIDLRNYIKPVTTEMEGLGIEDDYFFNPSGLGEGEYTISLFYTSTSGCSVESSKIINVTNPPVLSGESVVVCSTSLPFPLDPYSSMVGTEFTGPGVTNNYFSPENLSEGNYSISMINDQGNGCISQGILLVNVRNPATVDISDDRIEFCASDNSTFDLNSLVNRRGGEWTGVDPSGIITPSNMIAGRTQKAFYTYTDGYSCVATDSIFVVINQIPVINAGVDIINCYLGERMNLKDGTQFPVNGGRYEGPGVIQDTILNTASLGSGLHEVTYIYIDPITGCEASDKKLITLIAPPFVTVGSSKSLCISSAGYDLNRDVNDSTLVGEWTGTGIVGSTFEPQLAHLGTHVLTFTAVAQGGCVVERQRTITVVEEPSLVFSSGLIICKEAGGVNLSNHVNIPGGTWSSNSENVEGTIFNPSSANVGFYTVNYYVPSYLGCELSGSMSLRVVESDSVTIGPNIELCIDAGDRINLQNETSRLGGTYSGSDGIVDGFYFDAEIAGLGIHFIQYSIDNTFGCTTIATRSINVVRNGEVSGSSEDLSICKGGGILNLNNLNASPGPGIYSGQGIVNNVLNPSALEPGNYPIRFIYDFGNGCIGEDVFLLTISNSDIVEFGPDTVVCITSSEINLNEYEGLSGGDWVNTSGKGGVLNNMFFPSIGGIGVHTLTYNKQTATCEVVGQRIIQVVDLPRTPTEVIERIEGCVGETVELRAEPTEDTPTGIEIAWYRRNSSTPFALGRSVDFDIDSTEVIYFKSININGCESGGRGEISIVAKGPSGFISAEKYVVFTGEDVLFDLEAENASEFEWNFGDGTASTERNPYHYYYQPGKYRVSLTITSSAGCNGVFVLPDSITVENDGSYFEGIVEDTSSVVLGSKDEFINSINVYPNPFEDNINVNIDLPIPEEITINITDLTGRVLFKQKYPKFSYDNNAITIDFRESDYGGHMFILIVSGNSYSKHIKIVR